MEAAGIRIAEAVFWLDLILLAASAIALFAMGVLWSFLWWIGIVMGFELAKQLRQGRRR